MTELKQFKLPDVGEGLTEADIVKWHVQPGDQVTVNQTIVEIETAKAMVELPCPFDGVVTDLLVAEGQTVDVGTPIISVDVSGGEGGAQGRAGDVTADTKRLPPDAPPMAPAERSGGSAPASTAPPAPPAPGGAGTADALAADLVPSPPEEGPVEPGLHGSPAPKPERQPVLVGYGVKLGQSKRRPRKTPAASTTRSPAPPATASAPATQTSLATTRQETPAAPPARVAVLAKPPVRKLAKELGVDLAALTGSGPSGSITRSDVQAAAEGVAQAEVPQQVPAAGAPREERIPVRGVRKHTAAAVTASAFTAPHVTEFLQVDVTATMDAVEHVRGLPEFAGVRVSPLLFVAKALLLAVARKPAINASWDEPGQEIVVKHYVNLGIAAATDRGLIVPNVKDAHLLSLPGLASALGSLADTARAGKTSPADLQGGTITITNVGVFGVDSGTPILTPGEAAILAFGQVRDMPWVHEGALAVRKVCTLALSFDHRLVDGDLGSAVLRDVGAMLEDPLRMLAWS
jgi:2-oxoisovalerate dehydrogenase E2 component (dihydrolipoyl transacylase)